jgi:hypothetical protein
MIIEPIYVTFEQAKALKELGFNEKIEGLYFDGELKLIDKLPNKPCNTDFASTRYNSAPEQWQVVEWLRINHNIDIYPKPQYIEGKKIYDAYIWFMNENIVFDLEIITDFKTPQEAYSAAFDYILPTLNK